MAGGREWKLLGYFSASQRERLWTTSLSGSRGVVPPRLVDGEPVRLLALPLSLDCARRQRWTTLVHLEKKENPGDGFASGLHANKPRDPLPPARFTQRVENKKTSSFSIPIVTVSYEKIIQFL